VLCVEDWAEIRRLHRAEGMPIKVIARVMKVSRNTVRAAIASDRPPKYQRPAKGSIVDAAEPRIRELLQACPTMPAVGRRSAGAATPLVTCCRMRIAGPSWPGAFWRARGPGRVDRGRQDDHGSRS
jgi:transposase